MVSVSTPVPPKRASLEDLTEILRELAETVRAIRSACVQQTVILSARVTELEERVQDLEGHAEHGPDGECGVCAPETVGRDKYGDLTTADSESKCRNPHCGEPINAGDDVITVGEGMYVHDYC